MALLPAVMFMACSSGNDSTDSVITPDDNITVRNIIISSAPLAADLSGSVDDDTIATRTIGMGSGTSFRVGYQLGDSVGIFAKDGAQIPFALPITAGSTVTSANIYAEGWSTKSGSLYAVYQPYNRYNVESNSSRAVPWDYRMIQHQTTHDTRDHLGKYWFIAGSAVTPTVGADGTAEFQSTLYVMCAVIRVQCIVPASGNFVREMLVADDTLFATHGTFDLFDETGGVPDLVNSSTVPSPVPLPCTYQPFKALGHTDHVTLDIESAQREPTGRNRVLTCYFTIPETDLRGHALTLYLWDSDGNLYFGTTTATSSNGYLSRNAIKNIAFTNMKAASTLDVKLNDWEKEELCPTCTPVAW